MPENPQEPRSKGAANRGFAHPAPPLSALLDPILSQKTPIATDTAPTTAHPPGLPVSSMGIRIQIVEDEAELADFVVRGLARGGRRRRARRRRRACRGRDAVGHLGPDRLDWWLRGEDGLSVLQRFRQAGGAVPCCPDGARRRRRPGAPADGGGTTTCLSRSPSTSCCAVRALVRRRDRQPRWCSPRAT